MKARLERFRNGSSPQILPQKYAVSPDNSTSVLCVSRARRYAYDKICDLLFKYFTPKLGIEHMNKLTGKIEI